MEQVCNICGKGKEDVGKDAELTVLIICENCLRSDDLPPLLDQIFLS
jgi:hypothetical protein